MAQHTNWDKWMSENLRYALENNKNGKKLIYTYSEYYINHYKNNGYIDIVGKERYDSELNEDVIIEIKGSLSDLNSGHGQHFIGYFNFFATNREFLDKMIILYKFYIRFLIIRMNTILSNILKYRKTLILPRIYHD